MKTLLFNVNCAFTYNQHKKSIQSIQDKNTKIYVTVSVVSTVKLTVGTAANII